MFGSGLIIKAYKPGELIDLVTDKNIGILYLKIYIIQSLNKGWIDNPPALIRLNNGLFNKKAKSLKKNNKTFVPLRYKKQTYLFKEGNKDKALPIY